MAKSQKKVKKLRNWKLPNPACSIKQLIFKSPLIWILTFLVYVVPLSSYLAYHSDAYEQAVAYNAKVTEFNAMPREYREIATRFMDPFDYSSEDYTLFLQELPETREKRGWRVTWTMAIICSGIGSLCVFLAYAYVVYIYDDGKFYLADLPRNFWGVLLWLMMLIGWLPLATSLVLMIYAKKFRKLEVATAEDYEG